METPRRGIHEDIEMTAPQPRSNEGHTCSAHEVSSALLGPHYSASLHHVKPTKLEEDFVDSDSINEESYWIKTNFKRRECHTFIQADNDSQKCQCGQDLKGHSDPEEATKRGQEERGSRKWNHWTHASPTDTPTNAYGEIDFLDDGEQAVAKYVCVDAETEMSLMMKFMGDIWHMDHPNLVISVTGGAKNFKLRTHLKDAFRRGLMKAAKGTGAWIVTGGTNTGVMKHVGEAVRDYGLTAEGRVICIGITPWGCVQSRERLKCKPDTERGMRPASYPVKGKQEDSEAYLDPNHTHFILVDNGTRHRFATEIKFRARLEKEISMAANAANTGDAVPVPVCLLVLEGGHGTLEQVKDGLHNNTPTILIKGSGKCADVLAYAVQNVKRTQKKDKQGKPCMDLKLSEEIQDKVRKELCPKTEAQLKLWVGWVEQCVQKPDFISVFDLESTYETPDGGMDVAILKAILKANQNSVTGQLKLALTWNRVDIAKSVILTSDPLKAINDLDDMMMAAIQQNRVDFVDLFLDNGVSLRGFLTEERLLKLYREIPRNCWLYDRLVKVKSTKDGEITLEHVAKVLKRLLGDYYDSGHISTARSGCEETTFKTSKPPAQDLFLWAVLMNQNDMARLFWTKGSEPTAAALVASSLLKAMMERTTDAVVLQQLQENADKFENLAIGVINKCYSHHEQKAQDLLIREMSNWGKATCVLIAVQADNKRFISQTACQSLLNSIWMGKMSQDNGLIRLIPSLFFFPLILCLVKFKNGEQTKALDYRPPLKTKPTHRDQNSNSESPTDANPTERLSCWDKIRMFYTAPIIIFQLNCISYLVFLTLFSYVLLVALSREYNDIEGVLLFWVLTIFLEEVRQYHQTQTIGSKFLAYITDGWNLLDILTIILFFIGMVLRFIPNDTCFDIARVILSINLVSFFFRILHIYSVNKELGPKLVMIRRMTYDLMSFVAILMVFICAYAIASEAILYPKAELSWKLLYNLPRRAYWQVYGELFLEDIEGTGACTTDPALYNNYDEVRCPSIVGRYLVPVMMGIYVLMTNVLLLNLLIAMFSYTFQRVQDETDNHWNYQRFSLVREYYERPWLPPPFIVFSHVFMLIMWCVRKCTKRPASDSDFCKRFNNELEEKSLIRWENIIADNNYVRKMEAQGAGSVEGKMKELKEKLEGIQTKLDFLDVQDPIPTDADADRVNLLGRSRLTSQPGSKQDLLKMMQMMNQMMIRMDNLEEQMVSSFQALNRRFTKAMEPSEAHL
ncbi:hypothetical protein ACOMHN_052917 [Nucella lapillus]